MFVQLKLARNRVVVVVSRTSLYILNVFGWIAFLRLTVAQSLSKSVFHFVFFILIFLLNLLASV